MTGHFQITEIVMSQSFSEFEADARGQGFDEVLERRWEPLTVLGVHAHPFDAKAIVVCGGDAQAVGIGLSPCPFKHDEAQHFADLVACRLAEYARPLGRFAGFDLHQG